MAGAEHSAPRSKFRQVSLMTTRCIPSST